MATKYILTLYKGALIHLCLMDCSTFTLQVVPGYFLFLLGFLEISAALNANSVDPDQKTPQSAASSDQGLHCLSMSL